MALQQSLATRKRCLLLTYGSPSTHPTTLQHPLPPPAKPPLSPPPLRGEAQKDSHMKSCCRGSVLKSFLLCLSVAAVVFLTIQPFPYRQRRLPPAATSTPELLIRRGYTSYDAYLRRQLNKTLNPKLRRVWITRDWDRKLLVFSGFFRRLRREGLLSNSSKCLCIGARVGQEVAALREIGVADAVGIDLVAQPPLVVYGDFHRQPFAAETFDFEFSNVFDHALYPERFVAEVERTLKGGGVAVLHVAVERRGDKYSANDLLSVRPLVRMFRRSEVVHVRKVDGFGLDTEIVFRKKSNSSMEPAESFPP